MLTGALAALVGVLLFASGDPGPGRGPDPAAPPAAGPGPTQPGAAAEPGSLAVDSGQTLRLPAARLAQARLAVDLLFPEPSTSAGPLSARILAPDGRVLELEAAVGGADRRRASIEIDSAWLSPGRYIVELQTTERSHFPLRRYALEVGEP